MDSRKPEKRMRPPLSCETCRTRKLKCNRELPCDACVRRNRAAQCHYAPNASRGPKPSRPSSRLGSVAERLEHLEALVSSLLAGDVVMQPKSSEQQPDQQPLGSEQPFLPANHGDANHWMAVLESIKEVKDHLAGFSPSRAQSATHLSEPSDQALLLTIPAPGGPSTATTMDDILSHMPPQPPCDMLVSQYFNARFQVLGVVHPARFQREYNQFWDAFSARAAGPQQVSPLWLAHLFAILGMAACMRHMVSLCEPSTASSSAATIPPVATLQDQTTRCLVLGGFAAAPASAYTLETLLLRLQTSFMVRRQEFPPTLLWFDMGTILRQAVRLGYHRDPDHLPEQTISPLDAEMRRRVWASIVQIDALMSFQMGLPSMVAADWCDTQPPRNLQDADLREDTAALPPPRALEERTPVQHILAKHGVMAVFKKIVAHVQQQQQQHHHQQQQDARTSSLDAEMRAAYARVPDSLQSRDIRRCAMDTSAQIHERCSIELLYRKGLMVLHRGAMGAAADPNRRLACVEAALAVLDRQADLHQASQPGGRLYEDRWMMLSLMVHDFLLAAMAVCLDVSRTAAAAAPPQTLLASHDSLMAREHRALQASQSFWAARESVTSESRLALLALTLMLKKVEERVTSTSSLDSYLEPIAEPLDFDLELPYAEPMAQMIDGLEVVDWNLLDQYFQT